MIHFGRQQAVASRAVGCLGASDVVYGPEDLFPAVI